MKNYIAISVLTLACFNTQAFVVWPNASSPCNTTLQACIDGSPTGEYIEIRTNDVIDESLFSAGAVSLVAGIGYKPKLAATRNILINSNSVDTITIKGLTLLDGKIDIPVAGPSTTINILSNDITSLDDTSAAIVVRSGSNGDITTNINFNHVFHQFTGAAPVLFGTVRISKSIGVGGVYGDIYNNTISSNAIESRGVVIHNSSEGEIAMNIAANEIRGGTQAGAYVLNDGVGFIDVHVAHNSFNKDNDFYFPSGIFIDGQAGSIDAEIVNNTMVNSRTGIEINEETAAEVEAFIQNNIVFSSSIGFNYDSDATISSDYNLYDENLTDVNFTPGSNTINANPMFYSESNTRLTSGSPAIDSGNSLALLLLGSTPLIDADGTNRLKRNVLASAVVDRGAYESGDRFFSHTNNGSGSHITTINNPNLDGQSTLDDIHVSSNVTPNGGLGFRNNDNEAIYYVAGLWRIFNQSTDTDIAPGAAFNVSQFGSVGNTFEHTSLGGSNISTIDQAGLNGNIDKIVMMTQHWIGAYNPHPAGVFYGFGNWVIYNFDAVEIPENSQFNLYYQNESKSAWEHVAKASNISFDGTYLDNPLINDVPCAQIQITQSGSQGVYNARPVGVAFDSRVDVRKWGIVNQDASNMIENAAFYVMINPEQIATCSDVIFKDGFE